MLNKHFFIIIIISILPSCFALRLHSIQLNMYLTSSFDYCMRYLTKNSTTGCSSSKSGHQGRLIPMSSIDDLKSSKHSYPIIILIPARKDLVEYAIHHSSMVVGILLDGQTLKQDDDNHFTEVNRCPENFESASTCSIRKNQFGIDFRGIIIDKPIFLLTNQTVVEQIKEICSKYNQNEQQSKGKFIYAHMKSYPYAVRNAEICNRRSNKTYFGEAYFRHYSIKCRSPMINIVWSTLNAISHRNIRPPKSVIVLYTKFDFFSIFQPINAGVQSTAYGVVTLLSLAWVFGRINLSELLISNKDNKDILLLFLNGDNWNYYGRYELTKMILDKHFPYVIDKTSNQENLHPIEAEHIDIMINLDQIGINSEKTYVLYNNMHPFLQQYFDLSPSSVSLQPISENFDSFSDFHRLNISSLAILTNAYGNMNPFYNSYHDTLLIHQIDPSFIEKQIYLLIKTLCSYLNFPLCTSDLSVELKQILTNRIQALFDCFLQLNCTNLLVDTNETGIFYYKDVVDQMKENFSFLQPILHQSDVKTYINNHFLDASSYIHDILLNWLAIRTKSSSKTLCEKQENQFYSKFYQESTETCLSVSINSINLIRNLDEFIDDRILFISNSDQPELLIYLMNNSLRDMIILICGIILCVCGLILSYFVNKLLPLIFYNQQKL